MPSYICRGMRKLLFSMGLLLIFSGCTNHPQLRVFTDPALRVIADSLVACVTEAYPGKYTIEILERSSPVLVSRIGLGDVPEVILYSSAPLSDAQQNMKEIKASSILSSDTVCVCRLSTSAGAGKLGVPSIDIIPHELVQPFIEGKPESTLLVADFYPQLGEFLQEGWVDGAVMWKSTCRHLQGIADSTHQTPAGPVYYVAIFSQDTIIQRFFTP